MELQNKESLNGTEAAQGVSDGDSETLNRGRQTWH